MTTNDIALLEKRLIDSLFGWDVIEFEQSGLPAWATQGFFMKLSRALATGSRLSMLQEFYHQTVLRSLREEPDFVYGPAHKGIPLATLTAMAIGSGRDVYIGFNLPGNVKHSVHDVVHACADDVMDIRRIRVPFLETSRDLATWALDEAAYLSRKFEPIENGKEASNFGFNTIVGDGSAIPAATALAVALAHYGADADFAIPRRTHEAWLRADKTYKERRELHGDERRAKREASERLVVGRVRDHARYLLVSPAKESTGPIKNQPYEFGALPDGKSRAIIVDDSIVTGGTMDLMAKTLQVRYSDIKILAGVAAVHIQEVIPHVRGRRSSVIPVRQAVGDRLPLYAVIDSGVIVDYLHSSGRMPDDVYQRVVDTREKYKPQTGIAPTG